MGHGARASAMPKHTHQAHLGCYSCHDILALFDASTHSSLPHFTANTPKVCDTLCPRRDVCIVIRPGLVPAMAVEQLASVLRQPQGYVDFPLLFPSLLHFHNPDIRYILSIESTHPLHLHIPNHTPNTTGTFSVSYHTNSVTSSPSSEIYRLWGLRMINAPSAAKQCFSLVSLFISTHAFLIR